MLLTRPTFPHQTQARPTISNRPSLFPSIKKEETIKETSTSNHTTKTPPIKEEEEEEELINDVELFQDKESDDKTEAITLQTGLEKAETAYDFGGLTDFMSELGYATGQQALKMAGDAASASYDTGAAVGQAIVEGHDMYTRAYQERDRLLNNFRENLKQKVYDTVVGSTHTAAEILSPLALADLDDPETTYIDEIKRTYRLGADAVQLAGEVVQKGSQYTGTAIKTGQDYTYEAGKQIGSSVFNVLEDQLETQLKRPFFRKMKTEDVSRDTDAEREMMDKSSSMDATLSKDGSKELSTLDRISNTRKEREVLAPETGILEIDTIPHEVSTPKTGTVEIATNPHQVSAPETGTLEKKTIPRKVSLPKTGILAIDTMNYSQRLQLLLRRGSNVAHKIKPGKGSSPLKTMYVQQRYFRDHDY